ncbi:hypothetical protein D3C77_341310 [compost metagenome]
MHRILTLIPALGLATILLPQSALADECRLLSGPERIDYGTLDRSRLSPQQPSLALPRQTTQVSLSCNSPTDLSLFFKAQALDSERWQLGANGQYRIQASLAMVDGEPVELGLLSHVGATPGPAAAQLDWRPQHGVVPLKAGVPLRGRTLSLTLSVDSELSAVAFQVRDMIQSATSAQLYAPGADVSANLSMDWAIMPAACTPLLSNNGEVNYGKISAQSLQADKPTSLPSKHLTLSINCDSPARFALRMLDNRDGTALLDSPLSYGLGRDTASNSIGFFEVMLDPNQVSADSLPAIYLTHSSSDGAHWDSASIQGNGIPSKALMAFTNEDASTKGPVPIRNLSTSIEIKPVIAPTRDLDLRQEIELDGSATIEIVYL